MRGDGMDGLALAILLASLCILIAPALVLGTLGYVVSRKRRGWLGALAGVVIGLGAGALGVVATFMESTWDPPMELTLEVPPAFAHDQVLIVADPTASTEIDWRGLDVPLMARTASLAVPPSGVVRVRELGALDGGGVNAQLSSGETHWGMTAMNAPSSLGGGRVVAYCFRPYPFCQPELTPTDPDGLEALILEREGRR